MQSGVLVDQIDRVNRDVLVDQIAGADGCVQVIRDTADVVVLQASDSDCLSCIPIAAVEGD